MVTRISMRISVRTKHGPFDPGYASLRRANSTSSLKSTHVKTYVTSPERPKSDRPARHHPHEGHNFSPARSLTQRGTLTNPHSFIKIQVNTPRGVMNETASQTFFLIFPPEKGV